MDSYVRGKLGSEKIPYLRQGNDVVSYVALEFEEKRGRSNLVLGVSLESPSVNDVKTHFFVMNDYSIKDEDFINEKQVMTYKSFKTNAKAKKYDFKELSDTQFERKRTIGRDIFKLNDYKRFDELLQNSISFKPINEVSTFVNSFLLREDNINLDSLREEIRSYQNIHLMLQREKEKIEALKEFTPKAEKYIANTEEIKYLDVLTIASSIEKLKNVINRSTIELNRLEDEYNKLVSEENEYRENQKRLNNEIYQLENNEAYKALLSKKNQLEIYKKELNQLERNLEIFIVSLNKEQRIVRSIGLNYRFDEDIKQKDYGLLKAHLENYKEQLQSLKAKEIIEKTKIQLQIDNNKSEIENKSTELSNLKKGINNYPSDVINLIEIAKSAIVEANPREKNPICSALKKLDYKIIVVESRIVVYIE